jgi:hypothetical protein
MAIAKYATSYLTTLSRFDEAARWLSRAVVLDPLSPLVHADVANNFAFRRLDERFEEEAARVLEIDPAMVKLCWIQTKSRGALGNWTGAVEAAECALRYMPEDPTTLGFAASAYAGAGNAARAAELRGKLEFLAEIRYVPRAALAFVHDVPGGEDAYFRLMEEAIEQREPMVRGLRCIPRFQPFELDPRFSVLLEKVGLSDQDVAQAAAVDLAG